MKSSLTVVSLCAAIAVAATVSFAQPDSLWSRTYGGTGGEESNSVVQTEDGGYILGCATSSFGAGNWDVWMIKTDADGDTLWCRTFGGPQWDMVSNVGCTVDGGYFITGCTESFGAGNMDYWLIKTDSEGNTLWSHTYGGPQQEQLFWGQQTTDGGYILAGFTYSFGAGGRDFWLVKTNANGDSLWSRTFGGPLHDGGTSVVQTADSGYIFAGVVRSLGDPQGDFWLIKTDANGDSLWSHTYGGPRADIPYCVRQTRDGGYIVTGYTARSNGITDAWLLKTNADGNSLWLLTYGDPGAPEVGVSVVQTSDGGYAVAGGAQWGGGLSVGDVWLIRTDGDGHLLWNRTFGGPAFDMAYDLQQTADGGYVIMGVTNSFGAVNQDAWLIKTGPDPVQPVTWTQVDSALHRFYRAGNGVLGNYFYCFGTTGSHYWPQDTASAQAFNVTTEHWAESTRPPVGTGNYAGVATNDAIYLIGATTYNPFQIFGDVWKFIPTGGGPTGTYTAMQDYPLVAFGMAVAWDGGNYIYAAGGSPDDTVWYPYASKYDIATDNWTQIADAPVPLMCSGGAFLFGRFYVVGGWAPGTDDQLLEYNPADNTWAYRTGPPIPIAFPGFSTAHNDSLIFVIGGGGDTPHSPLTTAVQIYNPLTDTWTLATPLPEIFLHIAGNSACFVPPDKVISAGGYMFPPGPCVSVTYLGTGFPIGGTAPVQPEPANPYPADFALHQNYPNPFNPSTTIAYDLPHAGHVSLRVFDLLGREVAVLTDGFVEAGNHRVMFDGSGLASGIYFAQLDAGAFSQTKKLMLLK